MANLLPSALDIPADQKFGKPVLDAAFTYIIKRFLVLESFVPSYQAAVDALNAVGLDRINAAISPIYDRLAGFGQLGAIFSTTSTTTVTVANNATAVFTIPAADAPAFAAAAYIGVQHRGDPTTYMSGRCASYDRDTGTLTLSIDNVGGTGTFSDWIISASVEPPTNLDVGAALTAQLTAFEGVVNGEISTLQSNVNTQVASKAPLASPAFTGTPTTADPATNDSSTMIPTTRWVQALISAVYNAIAGVQNAVGIPVRADATQSLSTAQQLQARTNAGSAASGANTDITSLTGLGSMSCSGNGYFGGTLTGAGVIGSTPIPGGLGQIVAKSAGFSMGLYADGGAQAYLMSTATGNPNGGFSSFRPFSWSASSGIVSIAASGQNTNVGGGLIVAGGASFGGRPSWAGLTPFDTGNFNPAAYCTVQGGITVIGYNASTNRPYISGNVYHDLAIGDGQAYMIGMTGQPLPFIRTYDQTTYFLARCNGANLISTRWNGSNVVVQVDTSEFALAMASDVGLKDDIADVKADDALNSVKALRPVEFNYSAKHDNDKLFPGRRYGFIAQDLEQVMPSIVRDGVPDEDGDTYKVLTSDAALQMCALLVKSNQEMAARIAALEAKLS